MSSRGILFYGFPLDEEETAALQERAQANDTDIDTLYVDTLGLEEPKTPYAYDNLEWSNYFSTRREYEDACPVELDYSGYLDSDYPPLSVVSKKLSFDSGGWDTVEIDPLLLVDKEVQGRERLAIQAFCVVLGITYQEPKFYLTSYYG